MTRQILIRALIALLAMSPLRAAADGRIGLETRAELAAVARAVERYRDIEVAKAEGWKPFGGDEPMMGQHWNHPDAPDYTPEVPLDFTRPNNLMYTWIGDEAVLTGVAYVVRIGEGEALPEGFTGDADHWHVHDLDTILAGALAERPVLRWLGRRWLENSFPGKEDGRRRLAMVHVWVTVPNPDGPFALHNPALPFLKHGLPPSGAARYGGAVARGLALAAPDGCENVFGGRLWLAQATRRQQLRIMETCERMADAVNATKAQGMDKLAAVAAEAANRMASVYWVTLERAQHEKIGSISDHADAFCQPPA